MVKIPKNTRHHNGDDDDAAAVYDNDFNDEQISSSCGQFINSHWGSGMRCELCNLKFHLNRWNTCQGQVASIATNQ